MSSTLDRSFEVAKNSIDPSQLEDLRKKSETEYYEVPFGCRWDRPVTQLELEAMAYASDVDPPGTQYYATDATDVHVQHPPDTQLVPPSTQQSSDCQDSVSQTENPETELFDLIVFDLELLNFIGRKMPRGLNTICKLVISPAATLFYGIYDPRRAESYGIGGEMKCTQTAPFVHSNLVSELFSCAAIVDLISRKNEGLAKRLGEMYGK